MNSKPTLIALILAVAAGTFYYFYEVKGGEARAQAEKEAKKVFPSFKESEPVEVGIRTKDDEVYLKNEGGTWFIQRPIRAQADEAAVRGLLDQLIHLSREEIVVEKDADLREFGLDKPSGTVSIKPVTGTARTVFFGMDNPTGMSSYAMVDGEPEVFMVTRGTKVTTLKTLDQLRDKVVWRFEPGQVTRIISTIKDGRFELAKNETGHWNLVSPVKAPAKDEVVRSLLSQYQALRIESFVEESDRAASKYGVGSNASKVELRFGQGQNPYVLYVGSENADSTGYFARRVGVPKIVSITTAMLDGIRKKPEDLRDKRLVAFRSWEIEKFDVEGQGGNLTAQKVDGAWQWVAGNTLNVKATFNFQGLLNALSNIDTGKNAPVANRTADMRMRFYDGSGHLADVVELVRSGGPAFFAQSLTRTATAEDELLRALPY